MDTSTGPRIRGSWKLRIIDPVRAERTWKLLCDLRELIRDAQKVDTRHYEERESESILRELVPVLLELLGRSEALLDQIFQHYESDSKHEEDTGPAPELSFESTLEELMSTGGAARRIADISFIARMELGRMRHKLGGLGNAENHWEYVSICASIRRRILKSTDSLERSICQHEGLPSENAWHENSVQIGLMTRRAYAIFVRGLKIETPPSKGELYMRVRSAGSALAKLIGRQGYEDFKMSDRRLLRSTRQRILEWLRKGQQTEGDLRIRTGFRLWQDVVGVANLILQVSNRPELIEYDCQIIGEIAATIENSASEQTRLEPPQEDRLRSLYGRDRVLDRYIDAGDFRCTSELRSILERLRAQHR